MSDEERRDEEEELKEEPRGERADWKKRTLSDDEQTEEKILKVVLVGDGSSGKTSLCQRFARDNFDREYHQTIGLDFFSRRITLPGNNDGPPFTVLLQVWDIGGQSMSSDMLPKYLAGVHCVLLVYDVTNRNSFDNLKDWYETVRRNLENNVKKETDEALARGEKPKDLKFPIYFLVANKIDIDNLRSVDSSIHMDFMDQCHLDGDMYTSSRTGDSVLFMFRCAAAKYLGIQMTKVDQEADIVITKGEIAPEAVPMRRSRHHTNQSQTSVCSIQ